MNYDTLFNIMSQNDGVYVIVRDKNQKLYTEQGVPDSFQGLTFKEQYLVPTFVFLEDAQIYSKHLLGQYNIDTHVEFENFYGLLKRVHYLFYQPRFLVDTPLYNKLTDVSERSYLPSLFSAILQTAYTKYDIAYFVTVSVIENKKVKELGILWSNIQH